MRNFDEIIWWNIYMRHFYGTLLWYIFRRLKIIFFAYKYISEQPIDIMYSGKPFVILQCFTMMPLTTYDIIQKVVVSYSCFPDWWFPWELPWDREWVSPTSVNREAAIKISGFLWSRCASPAKARPSLCKLYLHCKTYELYPLGRGHCEVILNRPCLAGAVL